ncbi:MAG: TldD/PmbA family protein [Pseudomonadota bacterium]
MTTSLEDLTDTMLAAAQRAGAEAADAIAMGGASVRVSVRAGALEQAEAAEGVDIGLRVLMGGRQACVSASDTSKATIETLAERACAMAREAPVDPHAGLAEAGQLGLGCDLIALDLNDTTPAPSPDALRDAALAVEEAALAVKGVTQVSGAAASHTHRDIHLAATNGFSAGYARSDHSLYGVAIAGEGTGMERDSDGDSRIHLSDLRGAEDIGRSAGERAVALLHACKPKTGAYPVLYDERVAGTLIGHLLGAANGQAIARGASWLRERLGEQVLPTGLDLVEDPHRPRVAGSRAFDAEGLPTARRAIVEAGVLQGWTLDLATARKLDATSTANAARGTSSPPSPGNWNIALTEGTQTREELMADMGTGLLVTSMIGATINPNTGDYSRGASGFWIENGKIAYPVNECTIAGSLPDMLRRLIPANDARTHLSRVVPSLLIEGMTLAGS